MLSNEDLEKIEYRYLETISSALKSSVSSMVDGLKSMNKIKDYWSKTHKRGDGFDSGFERIIILFFKATLQILANQILVW